MKNRRKWIIWSIIIIAVMAGIFVYYKNRKPKEEIVTETVTRGDLSKTVSSTGELVSDSDILLNFEVSGRIKTVNVAVGKKLAKGDVIASVEDQDLQQSVVKAKALLDKAMADAAGNNDQIREAQTAVDNANNFLDDTKDLEDQKVDAAEQDYENAKNYYNDTKAYYDQVVADSGAGSAAAKNAKTTLTAAENSRESAKESLDTVKKSRDLAETVAQNNLNTAEESLKTAESDLAERSRDATVASAQADYQLALNNLDKSVLKAPVNGVVSEINNKVGEILGSSLSQMQSTSFAKMVSEDFIIESNVPESDIAKVAFGQNVAITFDALDKSDVFQGQVVTIYPASTVIQDVVYYKIKVGLDKVDPRLKTGMSANLDISTAEAKNVLMIPSRAVKQEGDKEYAEVLKDDGTKEKVYIETGLEGDEGMVEVKSGLSEGDKVITFIKGT